MRVISSAFIFKYTEILSAWIYAKRFLLSPRKIASSLPHVQRDNKVFSYRDVCIILDITANLFFADETKAKISLPGETSVVCTLGESFTV